MKAKKLLLGIVSSLCLGFGTFSITSCTEHAHEWVIDNVLVEPTCTNNGVTVHKCTGCGEIKYEVTDEKQHDFLDHMCVKCHFYYYTEGLEFILSEDGTSYTICDYDGTNNSVVIPFIYRGKPVISISKYAFEGCTSLTNITIPDSVTTIGEYAFWKCSSLKYVYYTGKKWKSISIENNNDDLIKATVIYSYDQEDN